MDSLKELPVGTHLAGKYRVTMCVGETEAYRTYVARDSLESRSWILRQLPVPTEDDARKPFLKWFYAEGERQLELKNPQLPEVNEFFLERGAAWTVTEHVEAPSLALVVAQRETPVDEALARTWLLSLAKLLHYLHVQPHPMVIGGFTAKDIAVEPDGTLRLLDYGSWRLLPEAVEPSRRDDVVALGQVVSDVLAHDPQVESLAKARPDVSADLVEIVERCLGKSQKPRFESPAEIVSWLTGEAQEAERNPPRPAARPESLRFVQDGDGVLISAFRVVNEGGGVISGDVAVGAPWLKASPTSFEGNDAEVQVWIDANRLGEQPVLESQVAVTTPFGNLAVPIRVETAAGRVRPWHVWAAAAAAVLVGGGTTAGLIWLKGALQAAAQAALGGPSFLPSAPETVALARDAQHLVMAELAAVVIVPLLLWGLLRTLPAPLRGRLQIIAGAAMLAPGVVTWAFFRDASLTLPPGASLPLQRLDPHFADLPMLLTSVALTALLALPAEHLPGLSLNPNLRWALVFAVLVLHFRAFAQLAL